MINEGQKSPVTPSPGTHPSAGASSDTHSLYQTARIKLVRWIAWLFRFTKIPKNYPLVFELPTVIVTQSKSIIIEGLLTSIMERAYAAERGTVGIQYWNGEDCDSSAVKRGQPSRCLYWCSLHDAPSLEKISKKNLTLRTLNVFQVRGPTRDSPSYGYSLLWLLGLIPTRRLLVVTFGSEAISSHQTVPRLLRLLKVDFFRNLRLVRGNPFHSHAQQKRVVLHGTDFERELKVIAARNQVSLERARELAGEAFDELAAAPKRPMYDILSFVAGTVIRKLFGEVHTQGLDKLKGLLQEHTVVLVPMHRSHFDYVVIGDELYRANITPPLVAAGINLSFWPMGFLFRSVGAYFVKRNARDRFHAIVLRRYVSYLVKRGHTQEFFIEGGRSRSGKMLPPKLGLLGVFVDAWKKKLRKDLCFVPVSLSYEHLVEAASFGTENSGASKVKEDFFSMVKAFNIFEKSYGEVTIEFGDPVFLNHFAENECCGDTRKITEELGRKLCRTIQSQISPTLSALAYLALMTAPRYALSATMLQNKVLWLRSVLESLRAAGQPVGHFSRSLNPAEEINFEMLLKGQILEQGHYLGEVIYSVPGERRFRADFYKNAVAHYYIPLAMVTAQKVFSLSEDEMDRLYDLLKIEYLLPESVEQKARLMSRAGGILTDSQGDRVNALSLVTLLLSSLEAAVYVHDSLRKRLADEPESERAIQSEILIQLQDSFKSAQALGFVSRTEVSAKSTLHVAIDLLHQVGAIEVREGAQQQKEISWKGKGGEYVELCRKLGSLIREHSSNCSTLFQ